MSVDIPTMTQVDSLHCRPFNWRRRMFDKCPRQTKQTAHVRTTRPEAQTDGRVRNHDIFPLRIGKYSFNWKRYFRSGGNATRGLNIFFFRIFIFWLKKIRKNRQRKKVETFVLYYWCSGVRACCCVIDSPSAWFNIQDVALGTLRYSVLLSPVKTGEKISFSGKEKWQDRTGRDRVSPGINLKISFHLIHSI